MCVFGKMSKDIGMGIHKGTVVSFVPTLNCLVAFWGFHSYLCCFFVTCFRCFLGGRGYRAMDHRYTCMYI